HHRDRVAERPDGASHHTRPTTPRTIGAGVALSVGSAAGDGTYGYANGEGGLAKFQGLRGMAVTGGAAYVGTDGSIRQVELRSAKTVSTVAGDSSSTSCADSNPGPVKFTSIMDMATDGTALLTLSY